MSIMESLIITITLAGATFIGGYAVLQSKVARLEEDLKFHIANDTEIHTSEGAKFGREQKRIDARIDAAFKRIDSTSEKVTVLETDSKTHLDLPTAEKKFVTRIELGLHLEKIEVITGNTNKEVNLLMGKQDNIIELLRDIKKEKGNES